MSEPDLISSNEPPVVLITGAARRIGASLARHFHAAGYRVLLHYRGSATEAAALAGALNQELPGSANILQADLANEGEPERLAKEAVAVWQRLDLLINNASSFFPTPFGSTDRSQWQALIGSNLSGPFFLCQALADELTRRQGAIINLVDVHSERGLKGYAAYSIAKAGTAMMTKVLAKELAPKVRVNGISPGPILPPEGPAARDPESQQLVLDSTLLGRFGAPADIAATALFLARQSYVTGQIIAVDGGKNLYP
ncbi:pteridine reductase [Motiliproteus sediminis]|uniref:pteridine reductase n=1 Tax=Motiliproteus sediminis TaxID=1468178 RepID=UPI001AF01161|nr:pteridine reductase [Motiliproteus sediminis]